MGLCVDINIHLKCDSVKVPVIKLIQQILELSLIKIPLTPGAKTFDQCLGKPILDID